MNDASVPNSVDALHSGLKNKKCKFTQPTVGNLKFSAVNRILETSFRQKRYVYVNMCIIHILNIMPLVQVHLHGIHLFTLHEDFPNLFEDGRPSKHPGPRMA